LKEDVERGDEIKIYILGTSAGVPTKDRNVASILVIRKGEFIFFDFGEGTQRQVFKLGYGFRNRMKIFITHMHGDHIFGLPGLLHTLSLFKRKEPLYIYGPSRLEEFINYILSLMHYKPEYDIIFQRVEDGSEFNFSEYKIKAIRSIHDEDSFTYILKENDRPGRFNVELAKNLGIPRTLWSRLSKGIDISWGGKVFRAEDFFIPPPIKGRSIVYTGDTMPNEELVNHAYGADILIHEATYTSKYSDRSLENKHSTAKMAAEIAKKCNVKILVLTHFSARYGDASEILWEARSIFPASFIVNDLDEIEIPYVKPYTPS